MECLSSGFWVRNKRRPKEVGETEVETLPPPLAARASLRGQIVGARAIYFNWLSSLMRASADHPPQQQRGAADDEQHRPEETGVQPQVEKKRQRHGGEDKPADQRADGVRG